jgi:hypothetical protein
VLNHLVGGQVQVPVDPVGQQRRHAADQEAGGDHRIQPQRTAAGQLEHAVSGEPGERVPGLAAEAF